MFSSDPDSHFMQAAYNEAKKGLGNTSPNPMVGAVIVDSLTSQIIAKGYHHKAGQPHAEVEAFNDLASLNQKYDPTSLTLYVTLEPCSTTGRTPPCTEAIIKSKIKRVVVGTLDPNPAHAGRGIEILKNHYIEVKVGVLEEACSELNRAFNKWITTGLPWVIAKVALSLDGRITRPENEPQWLSSAQSQQNAHQNLRSWVDAILVGAETVRIDNPSLTFRLSSSTQESTENAPSHPPLLHQPLRIILTRKGELPSEAKLFTDQWKSKTIIFQDQSIQSVLKTLAKQHQVTSLLVEGGSNIFTQFFESKLVDEIHYYLAPLLTGGPKLALNHLNSFFSTLQLHDIQIEQIGNDLHLNGKICYIEML